jgi:hypothetical protein
MAIARRRSRLAGVLLTLFCFVGLPTASAGAAAGAPVLLTEPSISGSAVVGQTLVVSSGTWLNSPTSFEYQWLVCTPSNGCNPISGATSATLTLNQSFVGDTLGAEVVAINASGASDLVTVGPTAAVTQSNQEQPTSLRVTSSVNPAKINTSVVFTTRVPPGMAGGSLTFYENQQAIPGCAAVTVPAQSSKMTCTTTFDLPGSWNVSVGYSYPYDGSTPVTLSGSMTETVKRGVRVVPAPPTKQVGSAGPKGLPNFRLSVLAVRSTRMPHRFWFALERVTCVNHASAVLVKIGKRIVTDRCGARIELASSSLAVHRYYRLTLQAVRFKGNRVALRGPAYRERLFMPGNEVQWSAITGVKNPISGAAT